MLQKKAEIQAMRKQLEEEQDDELAQALAKAKDGAGDMIIVCVVAARGLKNTDSGLFKRKTDMSDPYTMVRVGGKKLRTKTIKDCLDPVWDSEWFSFSIRPGAEKHLRLDLYDYDPLTKDDPLGTAVVDVGTLNPGQWHDLKLPLEEPSGVNKLKERINDGYKMLQVARVASGGTSQSFSSGGMDAIQQMAGEAISGWGEVQVKVRLELMETIRMDKVDIRAQRLEQQQDEEDRKNRANDKSG